MDKGIYVWTSHNRVGYVNIGMCVCLRVCVYVRVCVCTLCMYVQVYLCGCANCVCMFRIYLYVCMLV